MAGAIICVDIVQRSDCWKTLLACNRLKTMKKRKSASKNMVNINILIYIYILYIVFIFDYFNLIMISVFAPCKFDVLMFLNLTARARLIF